MDSSTFLEGITIGASAGLIAGIVLALLGWLTSVAQKYFERREQVRHLARTIEDSRDLIRGATDIDMTNHQIGRMILKDDLRKQYLDEFHREIQQILWGRASRLSFDEIQQIKQPFKILERVPTWVPNDSGYEGIFGHFESVEWLGLKPPL